MTSIREKRRLAALLKTAEVEELLAELERLSPSTVVNALFAGICSAHEKTRWNAITAMGPVVAAIADQEMEDARVVMRRFMWSLNDESGGIGWGAPESMGEILANHDGLAEEYTHVLVAFMREDGFYLELPELQRGLMWGIGRLAQEKPDLLHSKKVVNYQLPYLDSKDATVRGLAAWSMGLLKAKEALARLRILQNEEDPVRFLLHRRLTDTTVGILAGEAIAAIEK
jgi:hypothetical protein